MGLRCRRGLGRSFWFDSPFFFFWDLGFLGLGLDIWVGWFFVFDMGYVDTIMTLALGWVERLLLHGHLDAR